MYKLCRTFRPETKIANHHNGGGCTDFAAAADAGAVGVEKADIRAPYTRSFHENPDRWRKSKKEGGYDEADLRFLYVRWCQEARLKFERDHAHTIFPTMQSVGLCNDMSGAEDNLIFFKDGKNTADMTRFFPLSRWKKEEANPLDDEFSDEESTCDDAVEEIDSDHEDDSESSSSSFIEYKVLLRKPRAKPPKPKQDKPKSKKITQPNLFSFFKKE